MDAHGKLYTWNGSELVDKDGTAAIDGTSLVDAQGNLYLWNGSSLVDQYGNAFVKDGGTGCAAAPRQMELLRP